jgi:hypothetical protein
MEAVVAELFSEFAAAIFSPFAFWGRKKSSPSGEIVAEGVFESSGFFSGLDEGSRIEVTRVFFAPRRVITLAGKVKIPCKPGVHLTILRREEKYAFVVTK